MVLTHQTLGLGMVAALGCYGLGSLNFSILAGKLLGRGDPRAKGSGNAGATNVFRAAGWRVALPVLLLDFAKAFASMKLAALITPQALWPLFALPYLLGNVFPVFHGFKGGKGVAAAVGTMLAIQPLGMLLGGVLFLLALALVRMVSVGSLLMVSSYPVWIALLAFDQTAIASSAVCAAFIAFNHRANFRRILHGQEPRLGERPPAETEPQ